jgi:hypothetical protein
VRSLDGLQILGHASPACVRVNLLVRNFYATIARGGTYTDDAWRMWTSTACAEQEAEHMLPAGIGGGADGGGGARGGGGGAGGVGGGNSCFKCGSNGHWCDSAACRADVCGRACD